MHFKGPVSVKMPAKKYSGGPYLSLKMFPHKKELWSDLSLGSPVVVARRSGGWGGVGAPGSIVMLITHCCESLTQ